MNLNVRNTSLLICCVVLVALAACSHTTKKTTWGKTEYNDLNWERQGGAEIAKLWSTSDGSHAILVKMPSGYSSGPQFKDRDYHAVVISGSMTNADPAQEQPRVLGPGSFWIQPGGARHVTTCKGEDACLAYLVFERSARGIEAKTIPAKDIPWWEVPNTYGNVKLAWVWGEREAAQPSGFFLWFKAGFPGFPHTHTESYNGMVVQGGYKHWEIGEKNVPVLPAGSTFWQKGGAPHDDSCEAGQDCIAYFRIDGKFDIQPFPNITK